MSDHYRRLVLKIMIKNFRFTWRKFIPILILVVLAFTYRDVLRSMVLIPLAYMIFVFRLITGSVSQQTVWISFVVFSSLIAIISLAARRDLQLEEPPVELKYPTRLQTWIETVNRYEHSPYFKWNLAQDLSNLLIEAIAYHQGTSRLNILQQVQSGNIDLPEEIIKYLKISQKPFNHTWNSHADNSNWLLRFWQTKIKHDIPDTSKSVLDIEHEKIINYLENYLTIDNDLWEE